MKKSLNGKWVCLAIGLIVVISAGAKAQNKTLIYSDNFEKTLNPKIWKAEIAPLPNSSVTIQDGKLVLDTQGGVTVWFTKKLEGNIEIEYDWTVVVDGGKNDRLSDLNQFWMGSDPKNKNLFTRKGVFEEYDSLSLYYIGMGGNANSTTRFRKYQGNGERTLIQEYLDQEHLLTANHTYKIRIVVENGSTGFWVDGAQYFFYQDKNPLVEGYFGFRSTQSRHYIDNFKVFRLK